MLRQLDLRIGDTLELERAGDVIPKILGIAARTGDATARGIVAPAYCPRCGGKLREVSVNLQCNNADCQGVLLQRLEHFVSRDALDIEGFGGRRLEHLVTTGLVSRPAHLFALSEQQLGSLGADAKLLAANLAGALAKARSTTLAKVLFAAGIPRLGASGAKVLAGTFGSLGRLRLASPAALCFFKPVQFAIAQQVCDSLRAAVGDELERLCQSGVRWPEHAPAAKTVAITKLLRHITYLATATGGEMVQYGYCLPRQVAPWPGLSPALIAKLEDAADFPQTWLALQSVGGGDLLRLGIAKAKAKQVMHGLQQLLDYPPMQHLVREIEHLAGVDWGRAPPTLGALAGKKIAVTGTWPGYGRTQAQQLIAGHGGQVVATVTAHTDLVVAGDKPGAKKIAQAKDLGVAIIDQERLLALLEDKEP